MVNNVFMTGGPKIRDASQGNSRCEKIRATQVAKIFYKGSRSNQPHTDRRGGIRGRNTHVASACVDLVPKIPQGAGGSRCLGVAFVFKVFIGWLTLKTQLHSDVC